MVTTIHLPGPFNASSAAQPAMEWGSGARSRRGDRKFGNFEQCRPLT